MSDIETRGKPIKCKYCKYTFKIPSKKAKQEWQRNNCICPKCREEWCVLPKTERDLKYLQEAYLQNRCDKTLKPLILLLDIYCQSLIKKNYSKYLTFQDSLQYYSYHSVTYLIEEYLSKPDFKIEVSFAGYLIWKIKQAIFNPFELDNDDASLDFEFEDGNSFHELIACDRDAYASIEENSDRMRLYNRVVNIVEGIGQYCKSPQEDYIRTIALHLYLTEGETAFDKFFQAFGRTGKMKALETLDILRQELLKTAEH